jgi:hypothetical protein
LRRRSRLDGEDARTSKAALGGGAQLRARRLSARSRAGALNGRNRKQSLAAPISSDRTNLKFQGFAISDGGVFRRGHLPRLPLRRCPDFRVAADQAGELA